MRKGFRIGVAIPALDEAQSIAKVIHEIPDFVDKIVVGDNGSMDGTPDIARAAGALVSNAKQQGYGAACLSAIEVLQDVDIIVFVDGDYSDYPAQMDQLVDPIISGEVALVIGSRKLGTRQAGALTPQQIFGNWLACSLISLFWGVRYTDLGPFRAISHDALTEIDMQDTAFGWTVEMQLKAILCGLKVVEVPVDYRKRIGRSKISGTLRGTFLAGHAILGTIIKTALKARKDRKQ